jgi:hypothetical protein
MNKKTDIQVESRLLEARRKSLERMNSTAMRSHGKLWGMDVFSWFLPDSELIANTLSAFPFPVIWIGNKSDMLATLQGEEIDLSNMQAVICFDAHVFELSDKVISQITYLAGVKDVASALEMVSSLQGNQKVLLFTSSRENWEQDKQKFEAFLALVKV